MKPEDQSPPAIPGNRRKFLLGATLGGAGAVAAAVAGGGAKNAVEIAATLAPEKKPKGYRLTARIEQYYETTRI